MATTLYLRNAASDLAGAGRKLLSTTRGAASAGKVTSTVASGNDIQVTDTAGGQVLEWFTGQLNPVVILGNVTFNIRGLESATAANAAAGVRVDRCAPNGAVISAVVPLTSVPTLSNEYTTSDTAKNANFTPTATTLAGGDRLKVTLYVRAATAATMGGGRTVTNTVDGPTANAAGDTFVTFVETLVAFTGATASPATVGGTATVGGQAVASAVRTPVVLALAAAVPTPPQPQAAFVKSVGSAQKSGSSTTTVLTLAGGVNVPAGNRLMVVWMGDLAIPGNVVICDDSQANSYTLYQRVTEDTGGDVTTVMFSAPVQTALAPGDTITVTQSGGSTADGFVYVSEWTGSTIPALGAGAYHDNSSTPSSGPLEMAGAAVYFGALNTLKSPGPVTGTLGAPWTERVTAQNASGTRWYGVWTQQLATGATVTFAPTASGTSMWAAGLAGLSQGTEPPTPAVIYSWVGGVTSDGAVVVAKTNNASSVRLIVSASPFLVDPVFTSPQIPDGNGYTRHTVAGLAAGTWHYGVELDTTTTAGARGSFSTAPAGATSFSFVAASCALPQEASSWTRALARSPTLGFVIGDFPYLDVTTNDQTLIRTGRESVLVRQEVHEFLRKVPTAYTWSDHDFGANNANGSSASKPAAQAVYRRQVPHHALVVGAEIYHTFTYGRVRFIVTDNRSNKSNQADTDNSSKTVLGTAQKTWFKDLITSSTEQLIIWLNEQPWIGAAVAGEDEWSGYTTERTELGNHIAASGKRVISVNGDMHALAYSNGSNSAGSVPVFHAAPWAQTWSSKGGPYTQGPQPASTPDILYHYGLVEITDTAQVLSVRFRGFGTADTALVDATLTWLTPATVTGVAAVGTPTLPSGALRQPNVLACVASLPEPTVTGEDPSTSPDTVVARAGMGADTEPPTVPTGLHAITVGDVSADLAWNASSDNVAVASYEVVVAGPT